MSTSYSPLAGQSNNSTPPDRDTLVHKYQASGASLSHLIPGGTMSQEGDILEIEFITNTGTGGTSAATATIGGTTIINISGLAASETMLFRLRIGYLTDTTCWVSWAWEASTGTNDFDYTTHTVSSFASNSTFSASVSSGTSPDVHVLKIDKVNGPTA